MTAAPVAASIPRSVSYRGPKALWYLLGIGLALSSATQLRLGQVGPGECLIAVWVLMAVVKHFYSNAISTSTFTRMATLFFLSAMALVCLGSVAAQQLDRFIAFYFWRDITAIIFTFTVAWVISLQPDLEEYCVHGSKALARAAVIPLFLLWIYSLHSTHIGPVNLYWGFARFTGWSKDPNAVAIIIVPIPFLSILYFRTAEGVVRKLGWVAMGFMAVMLGFACLSDGAALAWSGGSLIASLVYVANILSPSGKAPARAYYIFLAVLLLLLLSYLVFPKAYHYIFIDYPEKTFTHLHKGDVRFMLWRTSFQAAMMSPIVGMGSGAHARLYGVPFEAHNSIIDITTRAGLIGVTLLLLFFIFLFAKVFSSRNPVIVAGFIATLLTSLVYFVMRHPEWWFNVFTLALLGPNPLWKSRHFRPSLSTGGN